MSEYLVSLVVSTTDAKGDVNTASTVRKYTFGDNDRYLAAGAAEALRQSAEELAVSLEKDHAPLTSLSGKPVRR